MFLHIGGEKEILVKEIICILNGKAMLHSDFADMSGETKSDYEVIALQDADESPKSIVIVKEKEKMRVYLSPIHSVTLQNRLNATPWI